jgi:hypothetical protein
LEEPAQLLWRERRRHVQNPPVDAHGDPSGVDEVRSLGSSEIELDAELVGAPAVVVVEEGDPGMRRSLDPPVAGIRHAAPRVPHHRDARVAERLEHVSRVVARPVVDDDDLKRDASLGERQPHGLGHEVRPVARRDDDRHGLAVSHPPAAGR